MKNCEKSWILTISQAFLGNLSVEVDHPPKMCAGLPTPSSPSAVVHAQAPLIHYSQHFSRLQDRLVQSMYPRQRTNEKPATANNEKASHETTAPRSRARTARKVQVNGLSRLCNHMGSITILHLCTNRSQLALEIERPVLTSQPHLGTESPCG